MAVTIKYKDLTRRLIMSMSIKQLTDVKDQLVEHFKALTDESWKTKMEKEQLMAQIGLISGVIAEKSKSIVHLCEKCGEATSFSLNMCEECFDEETDKYYDGGRDDE